MKPKIKIDPIFVVGAYLFIFFYYLVVVIFLYIIFRYIEQINYNIYIRENIIPYAFELLFKGFHNICKCGKASEAYIASHPQYIKKCVDYSVIIITNLVSDPKIAALITPQEWRLLDMYAAYFDLWLNLRDPFLMLDPQAVQLWKYIDVSAIDPKILKEQASIYEKYHR